MKHLILASLTALALAAGIASPALAQSANETRGTGGQPEAAVNRKHRTSPLRSPLRPPSRPRSGYPGISGALAPRLKKPASPLA